MNKAKSFIKFSSATSSFTRIAKFVFNTTTRSIVYIYDIVILHTNGITPFYVVIICLGIIIPVHVALIFCVEVLATTTL
ncbi:hypothetical protein ACJX0J_039398, partial [Zea mays]